MDLNTTMGSLRSNVKKQGVNFSECYNPCLTETNLSLPKSVAYCAKKKTDGYYSDGSYYDGKFNRDKPLLVYILKNRHKLRDKYEKTEWQEARDECMKFATGIKRKKLFEHFDIWNERTYAAYNDCLKERGY